MATILPKSSKALLCDSFLNHLVPMYWEYLWSMSRNWSQKLVENVNWTKPTGQNQGKSFYCSRGNPQEWRHHFPQTSGEFTCRVKNNRGSSQYILIYLCQRNYIPSTIIIETSGNYQRKEVLQTGVKFGSTHRVESYCVYTWKWKTVHQLMWSSLPRAQLIHMERFMASAQINENDDKMNFSLPRSSSNLN